MANPHISEKEYWASESQNPPKPAATGACATAEAFSPGL